jgi:glucosylglycerate synthase
MELTLVEESILTDDFLRQLIDVGEVDILVGLPTHNNAETVGSVVQAIQAGLLKSFARERVVIINADGGSRDGTPDLITGASISDVRRVSNVHALRTLHSISTQYSRSPEAGTALRTILSAAELLRAKACAVVSPESVNFQPDWIERLLRPIYSDNFDYVTPLYRRHKFEGLLMRNLLYPMTRAVYGKRIREPYASEFGFSARLGSEFLRQEIWEHEAAQTGAEILLTTLAIAGGYRMQQDFLGAKTYVEHSPSDLVPAMRQTVGALFWSLESNVSLWSAVHESQTVSTQGCEQEVTLEPVRINRKRLYDMFRSGISELEPVLNSILSAATLSELQRAAMSSEDVFRYSAELWVKTVYEFAASYHQSVISRDHVIQALVPLYRGRTFTFLMENRDASAEQVENNVELLCLEFERSKPYLLELWNGKK